MKSKNRKIKIFSVFLLAFAAVFLAVGCNKTEIRVEKTEYAVEFGQAFTVPRAFVYSGKTETENAAGYAVTDSDGKAVKMTYGTFYPSVGEYTLTYSYEGLKDKTVRIVCADTVAPKIDLIDFADDVWVGDSVPFPRYELSDISGINDGTVTEAVTDPDGNKVTLTDGAFIAGKAGDYTVTITAEDNAGNKSVLERKTTAVSSDMHGLGGNNKIWSFDAPQFSGAVARVFPYGKPNHGIMQTGFRDSDGEISDNGVLKLTVTDTSEQYFMLRGGLLEGETLLSGVKIRLAYVGSVLTLKAHSADLRQSTSLDVRGGKANSWMELFIDRAVWSKNHNDMAFSVKAVPGTELYIDYVEAMPYYSEPDLPDNVLATFDKAEYEGMLQYAGNASGVRQEILLGGWRGSDGGVVKVDMLADSSGFKYTFAKPIAAKDVAWLNVRMYIEDFDIQRRLHYGVFGESGIISQGWMAKDDYSSDVTGIATGCWKTYSFPTFHYPDDSEITGIEFYYLQRNSTSSDIVTAYIDEISYAPHAPSSKDGVIVDFDTKESVDTAVNFRYCNMEKYSFSAAGDGAAADSGKLAINSSRQSSGFQTVFSSPVDLNSVTGGIYVKYYLDAEADMSGITGFYKSTGLFAGSSVPPPAQSGVTLEHGKWAYLYFDAETLKGKLDGSTSAYYLYLSNSLKQTYTLYIDEIGIYEETV